MTEEEARSSPFRNHLSKSVGNFSEVDPFLSNGLWERHDVLLVCSDGLSEYVSPEDIASIVRSGAPMSDVCNRLTMLARERGGHDNISVAAAYNGVFQSSEPQASFDVGGE
jgi:protein phosphatase